MQVLENMQIENGGLQDLDAAHLYSDALKVLRQVYEPAMKLVDERDQGLEIEYKEENGKRTPVTNADIRINAEITAILRTIRDLPVVSEESLAEAASITTQDWWLIDPLDGTSSYIKGFDGFASCISLIQDNRPTLGVIIFPGKKVAYFASRGGGAHKLDLESLEHTVLDGRRQKYLQPRFATFYHYAKESEFYKEDFLRENNIQPQDVDSVSAALKYCLVAEGEYRFAGGWNPIKIWDVSAADILAEEAHCEMRDKDGNQLSYLPISHAVPSAIVTPVGAFNS